MRFKKKKNIHFSNGFLYTWSLNEKEKALTKPRTQTAGLEAGSHPSPVCPGHPLCEKRSKSYEFITSTGKKITRNNQM